MNSYSSYGGPAYLGAPPDAPPRYSSLRSGSSRLDPYPHRNSESSSIHSGISSTSRRSSSDSSKPRLSKEQQTFLEQQFNCNQKPNTETKKGFADTIGVSAEKVNNWFQNKRAKTRNDAKKTNGAQLAYQLYYQHGGNMQDLQAPYRSSSTNAPMDPNHSFYQFPQPPMFSQSGTFYDASMEPSLDVSNLSNEESHVPHYGFQDTSQDMSHFHEPYAMAPQEDDMARFFGLGGQVDSIDNLQQQQRRFGSGAAMGTISEEVEEGNPHASAGSQESTQVDNMTVNLNDSIDPAAFEMPFDAYAYAPDQGPNATWGASAGTHEQETRHVPPPSLPQHYASTLPFRSHEQDYSSGVGPQYAQSFEHPTQPQPHPPHYDQPMVPAHQQQQQTQNFQYYRQAPPMLRAVPPSREASMGQNLSPETLNGPRRDSIVSNLADHVGQVDVQAHRFDGHEQTVPTAIAHPAPRRIRRPPPLSTTTRTTSHGISVPPSPRNPADTQLRRIKSSGNFAGRIQKSGSSSAQRSPMSTNFSHADLTRSISGQSMTNLTEELWQHDSKGPMTPASPAPHDKREGMHSLSASMSMPQIQQAYLDHRMSFDAPPLPPPPQQQRQQDQEQQHRRQPLHPTFFSHRPLFDPQHNTIPQNQMSPPETPSHFINTFASNPKVAVHTPQRASTQPTPNNSNHQQSHQSSSEYCYPTQSQQQITSNQGFPFELPPSARRHGSSASGHSNHVRTATAQYVGPPEAHPHPNSTQAAGQVNGFSGTIYHLTSHSPSNYPQQVLESQARSVHFNGPPQQPPGGPPHQHRHHPQLQYCDSSVPHLPPHQPSLPSDRRPSSSIPTHPNHRPPSASLTQPKTFPYTSPDVMAQHSGAFTTWDLNEGRRPEPSPSPPQEKQYTFLHVDGMNGIASPKTIPTKSAGPSKSYERIEFCHTSPKAFKRETSGTEVDG